MKLCLISDTHNQHDKLILPSGCDILVHAGDMTNSGKLREMEPVANWLNLQSYKFKHVVCVAGNHDWFFEGAMKSGLEDEVRVKMFGSNVHYLRDSGVELEGLRFWGSPWQPWFYDWAFNAERGAEIKKHWDKIPNDTDVLVTHGPPINVLDWVGGRGVGCEELAMAVEVVKPRVHVFGHIHCAYGQLEMNGTRYFNASVVGEDYKLKNEPFVVET